MLPGTVEAMTGSSPSGTWTNASVLAFAGTSDPMEHATATARQLLAEAAANGMVGPPVDVMDLAALLGIGLRPHNDVADASIGPGGGTDSPVDYLPQAPLRGLLPHTTPLVITYNPTRPKARLRFSVAHEIAHGLFPDVGERVRHRTASGALPEAHEDDSWEVELLCNVIAAELLLPPAAVEGLLDIDPDIDFFMETRRRWGVSTEALLRKIVSGSSRPMSLLALSWTASTANVPLRVDYVAASARGVEEVPVRKGNLIADTATLSRCTAIGQTVRGSVEIEGKFFAVQAVGIPGYPGQVLPRILALFEPSSTAPRHAEIRYEQSDLAHLEPSDRPIIIGHVVTDAAHTWSRRGIAAALSGRYPQAARAFRSWSVANPDNLKLGQVHVVDQHCPTGTVWIASLVAQHGYGPSGEARLRYDALGNALREVAALAERTGAAVHVPRIGAGQAGGRWDLIEDLLAEHLTSDGIEVTVHTLPGPSAPLQVGE